MFYKRAKLITVIFLITLVAFFTSDFQLIDIEKTAIIVALGIDVTDDGLIDLTAQVAIPQATDQSATNSDAMLTATGETLYFALENIALKTGWYPKLSFCNLILFGEQVPPDDIFAVADYLLTSNRFQNSAILAAAKGSAREVLFSTTPLDFVSSFALQKILLRNLDRANSVMSVDVRQFCADNRSRSGFCYLPLVCAVEEAQSKQKGDSGSSSSQEGQKGGGKNSQGGSSQPKNNVLFDATSTLIFTDGNLAGQFIAEQTHFYNLLTKPIKEGFIPVSFFKNGKEVTALLSIVRNKADIDLEFVGSTPVLKISLLLVCEKEELLARQESDKLSAVTEVSAPALKALEQMAEQTIASIWELGKQSNTDLFLIKEKLYRFSFDKYPAFKDNVLDVAELQISVDARSFH